MTISSITNAHNADLWEREYKQGGIPSSVRVAPSNTVVDFIEAIRPHLPSPCCALDIGCGSGRNSLFLANEGMSVSAMDFAETQISALNAHLVDNKISGIDAIVADVGKPWPWSSERFDCAIDTFCFKHQIAEEAISNYVSELQRCMKPGGYFLLFLASRDDAYYRQFPVEKQSGRGLIIIDRGNGIASRLYDRQEVETIFDGFTVVKFVEKPSANEMHGRTYQRSSLIWYMRRS